MRSTPGSALKQNTPKELNYCNIDLTPDEAEILCQFNLEEKSAAQQNLCGELSNFFSKDRKNASADTYKAKEYQRKANALNTPVRHSIGSHFHGKLSWFTSARLFVLRSVRVFEYADVLHFLQNPVFKHLLAIGGLSYFAGLAWDLGIIVKNSISYLIWPDEEVSFFQRVKNICNKDDRPFRMRNNLAWGVINAVAFALAPVASAFVNLGGFLFDVGHEVYKKYYDLDKYQTLLDKVTDELQKTEMAALANGLDPLHKDKSLLEKQSAKIHDLSLMKEKLETKVNQVKKMRDYGVFVAVGIFIGMVIIRAVQPLVLVGAVIAWGIGSVIGGFGKRIYDLVTAKKSSPTASKNKPAAAAAASVSSHHHIKVALPETTKKSTQSPLPASALSSASSFSHKVSVTTVGNFKVAKKPVADTDRITPVSQLAGPS